MGLSLEYTRVKTGRWTIHISEEGWIRIESNDASVFFYSDGDIEMDGNIIFERRRP
jgi:hypothetical protein